MAMDTGQLETKIRILPHQKRLGYAAHALHLPH
jgi:hypothetical protein